jgi:hypothetical protein
VRAAFSLTGLGNPMILCLVTSRPTNSGTHCLPCL